MRRSFSALAALCVVLLSAAPASGSGDGTAGPPARAVDFAMAVPSDGAAAATAGGRWTSPVLRAPKRFDLVGLRWRWAPEYLEIDVRTRTSRGRWSPWVRTGRSHSARTSDPVWAGGADVVQVRLSRRVRGLALQFVNSTGTATRRDRARLAARARLRPPFTTRAAVTARAAQAQPAIVPRSEWAGNQCAPRGSPSRGRVQMAFVHHTVGTNDYSREESAALVLAICRFHRNGNGWDDIGYNFLVDKYGQVFEGRAGGIDQPIVGAQAQGFNSESTGIANLGTFQTTRQSEAALQALGRLIAWKLPLHGAPVDGEVVVRSAGGSTNRHSAGKSVTFPRIAGHREGNATECPGDALFAQLGRIRAIAAERAPDVVPPGAAPPTLTMLPTARSFTYPQPVRMAGRLADSGGNGMGGQQVKVQIATSKAWRTQATATTAPDGSWSADVRATRSWAMRAVAAGVASPKVRGVVAPAITARASVLRVRAGRSVGVRGTLLPRRPTVLVEVARKVGRRYVRSFALRRRARRGAVRTSVPLRRPGLYRIRLRFAGDRRNGAAASPGLFVRATVGPTGGTAARAGR